jgi:transposase
MLKGKTKYEDDFKRKLVDLYNKGKPASEITREYHISSSALWKWVKYYNATGSFKEADNLTENQIRTKELEKEVRQLRMENDILKQAALIMGRK